MVDDRTWTIRYLLIDTSNWIGGRAVLIPPERAWQVDGGMPRSGIVCVITLPGD